MAATDPAYFKALRVTQSIVTVREILQPVLSDMGELRKAASAALDAWQREDNEALIAAMCELQTALSRDENG